MKTTTVPDYDLFVGIKTYLDCPLFLTHTATKVPRGGEVQIEKNRNEYFSHLNSVNKSPSQLLSNVPRI